MKLGSVMGLNVMRKLRLTDLCACLTKNGVVFFGLLLFLVLPLSGTRAWSQAQNTGSIFGNVVDKSGAVIPSATIATAITSRSSQE